MCETRETFAEEIKYSILKELNNVYNTCLNGNDEHLCEGMELAVITVINLKFGGKQK